MKYITHKRFKDTAICGEVNIPYGSELDNVFSYLFFQGLPICLDRSQNAYDYFARNDDGKGLERGKLTSQIKSILAKNDDQRKAKWIKIWDDELCQKYKRKEFEDFWLWNHDFYNAPIEDLLYIVDLITR